MKNVTSSKGNNTNSAKTPGGISKSLLTPCRRVGLSRNWKKSGPSPFISPLASSADGNQKKTEEIDDAGRSPAGPNIGLDIIDLSIEKTPHRNVALPRKNKSRTLLTTLCKCESNTETRNICVATVNDDNISLNLKDLNKVNEFYADKTEVTEVSTPVRVKSKSITKKKLSHVQSSSQNSEIIKNDVCNSKECYSEAKVYEENAGNDLLRNSKDKSPHDLKRECIVVIQKKIFNDKSMKCEEYKDKSNSCIKEMQGNTTSQTLFESDSDDVPLCQLNKKGSQSEKIQIRTEIENDDDDFIEHKSKIRKLDTTNRDKQKKDTKRLKKHHETVQSTKKDRSEPFDDNEDFDFDNKRTILVCKTYEKVTKPLKAKSTGSITQKDIDDLKARIEVKKKVLLAKTTADDTTELRDLIKKWQKGCQDALMELMDLMKRKFPEKSNMDYSEILQSLHIPASLVGYDSDNDCFNTPDDTSIVLASINDL